MYIFGVGKFKARHNGKHSSGACVGIRVRLGIFEYRQTEMRFLKFSLVHQLYLFIQYFIAISMSDT